MGHGVGWCQGLAVALAPKPLSGRAVHNPRSALYPTAGMTSQGTPRILFATIAAGGAHVSSARAMAEAVTHRGAEARIYEPMIEYGFGDLDRRHKGNWRWMLAHPASIVVGQLLIDAAPRLTVQLHRWMLDRFARVAAERIDAAGVDLVVANHGWLAVALSRAQKRYGLATPVVTFETSTLNANALWADADLERCVTASPLNAERLAQLGVPAERIDVVGYPVRQAFIDALDKSLARRSLELDEAAFTVLMMFGAEGIAGAPDWILEVFKVLGPEVQLIVVTGRNVGLAADLEHARRDLPRLRIKGFVEDTSAYVAAADVVVAKTGPATVYEALAVGRPVLAPMRSGRAENRTAAMLTRHGLGGEATSPVELTRRLSEYRDDPAALASAAASAARFDFPGMAERLGQYLVSYARTQTVPLDSLDRGLPWTS